MNEAPLPGSGAVEAVLVDEPAVVVPEPEFVFGVDLTKLVADAKTLLPLLGLLEFSGATLLVLDKSLSADRQPF